LQILSQEFFGKKHNIILGYSTKKVEQKGDKILITAENKEGKTKQLETDSLLVATGRKPNTDILEVEKAGIEVNEYGYVKVNEYLETTAKNIWALGDIVGKYLLKHSANLEAQYVYTNMFGKEKKAVDYWPMPHAIFTSPQIASVEYTEEELKEKKMDYAVGKYYYKNTGMGEAFAEEDGFVKILVDRKTRKILGCHIIGPQASTLIHEVVVIMAADLPVDILARTTHAHPAMSEVVQRAAGSIKWGQ